MAPPDSDRGPKSSSSAAFAATVGPAAGEPAADSGADTVAAPGATAQQVLPEVAADHYGRDREIARGGMGRIVAAEDRRLGRKVALKELLDGSAASDHLSRFQREALITARLQHPGIVPVYEAGRWPSGEPFFAMKLVSGRPLDKVIAEATRLEDRLALLPRLAAACDAIAYAHSQRIIHRDLKPGNVLIGDYGETVVIDWGLAKDLDADDAFESGTRAPRPKRPTDSGGGTLTVAGSVMGTPAYMPPEQARGEAVDQRADVFALGAMLYHLLAGVPPYTARTATDVIAAAALGKVVPLVERERRVPADLVAIVERAMAPLPIDRYETAAGLADELRRFLTGQLVGAHRYTAVQRVSRFVKRHRAAVTVSAVAIVGFAVGGTLALRNIVRARDEAQRAERIAVTRKQAAERLIDYMFSDMKTRLAAAGRLDVLAGLGAEVRRYYATLARAPGGMPREDEIRWAEAIDLIGEAEHVSGKPDQAVATWREARDKLTALVDSGHAPSAQRLRKMIARLDFETAEVFHERGQLDKETERLQAAKQEFDDLLKTDPTSVELLLSAADAHDHLGDLLRNDGKVDQAFDQYSEAKTERERATSQANGKVTAEKMALSTSHLKLGSVYQNRGDSQTALAEYQRALALRRELLEITPDDVVLQKSVLDVEDQLAELERQVGDNASAITAYRDALPVTQALVRRDPTNTEWARQRGNLLADLGFALIDDGAFKDGIAQLDAAIDAQDALLARDPKSARYKVDLSRSYTRKGDGLVALGDPDAAADWYRRGLDLRKQLADQDPRSVPYRRSLAFSYTKLAAITPASALDLHQQAMALRQQLVSESPSQGAFKDELSASETELARLLLAKEPARAKELVDHAVERERTLVDADPINIAWKETLVNALLVRAQLEHGTPAQAETLLLAKELATEALRRAPTSARWPAIAADVELALAETDPAGKHGKAARDLLEPLAKANRLAAPRLPLLARARATR
ncbi:MAG: protein kinase [Deltaproteobacteria bacterium]|nr:protein kinase [Deltaproteobacteria bacterium]